VVGDKGDKVVTGLQGLIGPVEHRAIGTGIQGLLEAGATGLGPTGATGYKDNLEHKD
jgi:hypothetical protein